MIVVSIVVHACIFVFAAKYMKARETDASYIFHRKGSYPPNQVQRPAINFARCVSVEMHRPVTTSAHYSTGERASVGDKTQDKTLHGPMYKARLLYSTKSYVAPEQGVVGNI